MGGPKGTILEYAIVLTLVLVIRKLQGCVMFNEWLSSVQDSNQDQDHREIYRQGKRLGYKMQSSIGQTMLLSLMSSVNYDRNKMLIK